MAIELDLVEPLSFGVSSVFFSVAPVPKASLRSPASKSVSFVLTSEGKSESDQSISDFFSAFQGSSSKTHTSVRGNFEQISFCCSLYVFNHFGVLEVFTPIPLTMILITFNSTSSFFIIVPLSLVFIHHSYCLKCLQGLPMQFTENKFTGYKR